MKHLQTAVDQINTDLVEFKSGYDARIKKLENLNILLQRPGFEQNSDSSSGEDLSYKHAFTAYIRKGDLQDMPHTVVKALSTAQDADGGYLIPQLIEQKITRQIESVSPLRRLSNLMTISTSAVEMLVDRNSTAEAGWAAETAERAETMPPKLTKIHIPVHELYARPRATQKLLDDSLIDIENWLSSRIALRMTQLENMAFLRGDGNNKPKGILHYPSCQREDWQWGYFEHIHTKFEGHFGNEGANVLIDTISALKAEYLKGSVWLMSRSAQAAVQKLKDANGHYLWQPGLGADATSTLLGYPVEIAEEMPELVAGKSSKSIIFGNFREAYQIVDRAGSNVLRDPYSAKPYVEFYTVKRVGGDVINFEALKIVNFDVIK